MSAPPKSDLTGKKVGEYEIISRLGVGGMGVVYEGLQPLIGKRVAVKVLLPGLSNEPGVVKRFLDEARAVNSIGHRGIVDIFSFGVLDDGSQYFVMEYLDGICFNDLIAQRAPLPVAEVLRLLDQILDALDAAHCAGIVHRDIKPSNIFLVDSGRQDTYVKLLDFGIAKLDLMTGTDTPQTHPSIIVGTPDYIAPEQARGQPVGPATDLYAVGCVAFELLTGKRPFKGDNPVQTMFMHVEQPPPIPSSVEPSVPAELDELLLSLLKKKPSERPPTAAHVRAIVQELRGSVTLDGAAMPHGERPTQVGRAPTGRSGPISGSGRPPSSRGGRPRSASSGDQIPAVFRPPTPSTKVAPSPAPNRVGAKSQATRAAPAFGEQTSMLPLEPDPLPVAPAKKSATPRPARPPAPEPRAPSEAPAEPVAAGEADEHDDAWDHEPPEEAPASKLPLIAAGFGVFVFAATAVWFFARPSASVEQPATSDPVAVVRPADPVAVVKPGDPVDNPKPINPVVTPKPTDPVAVVKPADPVSNPKPVDPVANLRPVVTPRPADPVARPADPVARPADPVAKPADPVVKPKVAVPKGPSTASLLARVDRLEKRLAVKEDAAGRADKVLRQFLAKAKANAQAATTPEQRREVSAFLDELDGQIGTSR
jgi:serine/threonine-protein kinase